MLGSATDDVNSGESPSGNPDIRQQGASSGFTRRDDSFQTASAMIAPATA